MAALPEPASASGAPTFIITLRDSTSPRVVAAEHARQFGADVKYVYEHALRGYAAKVSEARIGELARDGRVTRVERDGAVRKSAVGSWGLDRIDQRGPELDDTYSPGATGAGVTAYVIDTGISGHRDFGDRLASGVNFAYDRARWSTDTVDCDGHGTHVAGTLGGAIYGVASGVTLVPVRVLDCEGSGYWSDVAAGIDWVSANSPGPSVANLSLGGGASPSVDTAVRGLIASGVAVAVAAGNSGRDACFYSPARVTEAMTIGASTNTDARASYSNWGGCIDFFAPGSAITSAWLGGGEHTISGTSMASPHVAGAAALYLQNNQTADPVATRDALFVKATKGIVTSARSANNHLLFWGAEEPAVVPAPTKPGGGKGGKNNR